MRYLLFSALFPFLICCGTGRVAAVDLIGYVPWYRMDTGYVTGTLPAQLAMLDEVRYFGLTAASNGTIVPLPACCGGTSGDMETHLGRIATIKSAIEALPVGDRPRLNITIGAAGQDASFTAIAPNAGLRTTFAQNIKGLLDLTGATSVDIDWEGPNAPVPPNPTSPELTTHYPAMLKRIKQEVGASRRVYATIEPQLMLSNSVFSAPNAIDGVSVMTYDIGWWGNDDSNPFGLEHSLHEYVEDATEAWTEQPGSTNDRPWVFGTWGNDVPEGKLGVGLPFYGRTLDDGPGKPADAFTFSQMVAGGVSSDGNYYTYNGRSVWGPDPDLAAQRVEYAFEKGLQHIIIWELGQDVHPNTINANPNKTSLLKAAFEKKLELQSTRGDFDGDGDVDTNDYTVWQTSYNSSNLPKADGNLDGVVDGADYVMWRKLFPQMGGGATTTVPEPHVALLLVAAALLSVSRRAKTAG
jgi:hypothetical protein